MVRAPAYPAHGDVFFHLGIVCQLFTLGLDDRVSTLNGNLGVRHDIGDPISFYARIGRRGDESAVPIVDTNLYRAGFTGLSSPGCNFGNNLGSVGRCVHIHLLIEIQQEMTSRRLCLRKPSDPDYQSIDAST